MLQWTKDQTQERGFFPAGTEARVTDTPQDQERALSLPLLAAYVACVPEDLRVGSVASPARMAEIARTKVEKHRRQRYCVWRLLEYAAEHSLGIPKEQIRFEKTASGAWRAEGFCFSLSHTDGAVAVALSHAPVGIDIEPLTTAIEEKLALRIMTESERATFTALPKEERGAFALTAWCKKEALFKLSGGESFSPKRTESADTRADTVCVTVGGKPLLLAIASDSLPDLRLYTDIPPKTIYE